MRLTKIDDVSSRGLWEGGGDDGPQGDALSINGYACCSGALTVLQ